MRVHAWMYPGAPAQNAAETYRQGKVTVIKPQYFSLDNDGKLILLKEDKNDLFNTQNAYSAENVVDIKKYTQKQLVTVDGDQDRFRKMYNNQILRNAFIDTLVNFVEENGLTGIDLDLESFFYWTLSDWNKYKNLVKTLGTILHSRNKKLSLCGPQWEIPSNNTMVWKYNELVSYPIDYITPMTYDYQWIKGFGSRWLYQCVACEERICPGKRATRSSHKFPHGFLEKCWRNSKGIPGS